MKSLIRIITAALFLFYGDLFAQKKSVSKTADKPPVATSIKLRTADDSLQYSLGAYMGLFMIKGGFTTLSLDLFMAGLEDEFRSRPRMIADSAIYPIVAKYQAIAQNQRNKILEQDLFNELKNKPNVGKLPSGVQYIVIKQGKGARPSETDSVLIHFKGTLPDGTVFENTFLKNSPTLTTPANVIPGLSEALQLMQPGATWQLFIPSTQGYGVKGNGNIPPNSALLITVELLEIRNRR
jgi:FKBP-type peptidyl-prolyl cis-trans isomerase